MPMHLVSLLLIVFVLVSSFQENEKPAKDLDFARILPKEFSLDAFGIPSLG